MLMAGDALTRLRELPDGDAKPLPFVASEVSTS